MTSQLSLTLVTAALAFAQTSAPTPPSPATMAQMRVNMLNAQLNLTSAQQASALTIFTAAFTSAQSIQSNLQTNRTAMRTAIQNNDTATIEQLAATAGTLSGQQTAINAKAEAAFYALLTSAQQAIYNTMPHGGPGGFHGPGGPPPM